MNIQQLLELTLARNASDLHLVVDYPPMLRVHGDLIPVAGAAAITDAEIQAVLVSILSPLQKQIFENTLELDFALAYQNKARFRVNVFKERGHIAMALRFIPLAIPALDSLGLPPVVRKLTQLKQGLVLVTGPTGHGKSTTLAAMINAINLEKSTHIITVEDPIEYIYPQGKSLISQREMFLDSKSWPAALKASLREDPDVVLVGEMRDYETMAATLTIAETGHLVFATLHTNSAAQSVDRIIDVFPEEQQGQARIQLSQVLEAIISQRLIPTVMPGRALAVELLLKVPALSELIRSSKSHLVDNLIQTSGELGMVSLEVSLAKLVQAGKISFETAQNYCLRPDLFAKLVRG